MAQSLQLTARGLQRPYMRPLQCRGVVGYRSHQAIRGHYPNWRLRVISRLVRIPAIAALLLIGIATPGAAQQSSIPAYRSLIGFNPLGIPFDIASIEFETLMQQGITFGVAGSYVALDDDDEFEAGERWTSFDVKGRYYPGEVVLRGFSVGLSLGVTRYSERVFSDCTPTPTNPNPCGGGGPTPSTRESLVTPTIGVIVDYNFLLGAQRRFLVGLGVGAKRLLKHDSDIRSFDPPRAYPFGRFAIGLAF
jgi:hypothetical protein